MGGTRREGSISIKPQYMTETKPSTGTARMAREVLSRAKRLIEGKTSLSKAKANVAHEMPSLWKEEVRA